MAVKGGCSSKKVFERASVPPMRMGWPAGAAHAVAPENRRASAARRRRPIWGERIIAGPSAMRVRSRVVGEQ